MSRKKINREYEPMCVDCWKHPAGSETSDYQNAINVAMQNTDIYIEKNGKKHEDTIRHALMESITRQAIRTSGGDNGFSRDTIIPDRILSGDASYDQMVESVVNNHKDLPSIEIARLTHVGDVRGYKKVDKSIDDLHIWSDLDGEVSKDEDIRYKVRHMQENSMVLERKRARYRYLGGRAVVVACHSMLLDLLDECLSQELKAETYRFLDSSRASNGHGYHGDKDRYVDTHLQGLLEDNVWEKEDDTVKNSSAGSIPLTTIYYAVYRPEPIVQSVLKSPVRSVGALFSVVDRHR